MTPSQKPAVVNQPASPTAQISRDLTPEQRKIARLLAGKLLSALQIELPFAYVEKDGKRFYTLSGKRGAVLVDLVVTTDIPK